MDTSTYTRWLLHHGIIGMREATGWVAFSDCSPKQNYNLEVRLLLEQSLMTRFNNVFTPFSYLYGLRTGPYMFFVRST